MSQRFQELLKEEASCLDAFVKAKQGLEKVQDKLAAEKEKAQEAIKAKRAKQAEILAKIQAEIDEETEAINFVNRESKTVGKKIKSISKIVG